MDFIPNFTRSFFLFRHEADFQGRMLRRNRYAAALRLKTDVYEEDCDMLLRVQPSGALRGSVMGEWGTWTLEGTAAEDLPAPEAPAPVEAGNP